jgi:hypothetical protein
MPTRRQPQPPAAAGKPAPSRESDDSLRARGFTPFLRPEHVGDGETLSLTGFNYKHRDGEQICVTVANADGVEFVLGIREGSPDHKKFFNAFGPEYSGWVPGEVVVKIGTGSKPGAKPVQFVNVAAVTPSR